MPQSRFWRPLGTIAYLLSGIFLLILAFQAVKARISSGNQIPNIFGKRSRNSNPQEQTPSAATTTPFIDTQPGVPVL